VLTGAKQGDVEDMLDDTHRSHWRAIILIGPPGSGKGTQGRALAQLPGYTLVSMGNLLRSVEPGHPLGRAIRRHLDEGSLVPTETVMTVWEEHVEGLRETHDPDDERLLLDGIPRDEEQATLLLPRVHLEAAVHLDCPDEDVLMDRIRRRDDGRRDDQRDAVIRHRFDVYHERTVPLLQLLPPRSVHAVDAGQAPLAVLRDVAGVLGGSTNPCPPTKGVT
jgi:adenylate kinase